MKKGMIAIVALLVAFAPLARADIIIYDNSATPFAGGVIPDGDLVGTAFAQTLSGLPAVPITDVNVSLDLSGGWNGDLYAYLTHGSGFAVLLNRVGRGDSPYTSAGFSTAGMNVTLSDGGTDIHWVASPSGTGYAPDGRNISPLASTTTFSSTSPSALLSSFNGENANGTWTLYLADVSGGYQSTLNGWSLEIAAVPEPASLIEGTVAVLLLGGIVWLYRRKANKQAHAA